MFVSKLSICFLKMGYFNLVEEQVAYSNINVTDHRKSAYVVYSSWFSWRYESFFCFVIGGPSFFPRVAATMISKRFVKLGIKVYF